MKSSKASPRPSDQTGRTIRLPRTHEPAPGWSTTEPPTAEQFTRFEELTRKLVKVPKKKLDEKRNADG